MIDPESLLYYRGTGRTSHLGGQARISMTIAKVPLPKVNASEQLASPGQKQLTATPTM